MRRSPRTPRTPLALLVTGSLVATTLAALTGLTGAPAQAATGADDPTFTPTSGDLIGVGSVTSEHALAEIADTFNGAGHGFRIASYAGSGDGTIALPGGAITRPQGSVSGKALLHGSSNNPDVDFARSSIGLTSAEAADGLRAFPFAADTLVSVVGADSHAPASLSAGELVRIYSGQVTNWSQLGGRNGTITPLLPQAGSGTRAFFLARLAEANNGNPVTLSSAVVTVDEQDPQFFRNDSDAVGPFSKGLAEGYPGALQIEGGFRATRALYDVVRGADASDDQVAATFGPDGLLCSGAVRDRIEDAGFEQLATTENGGACGVATTSETGNLTVEKRFYSLTRLSATSPAARTVALSASVRANNDVGRGKIVFADGGTTLATVELKQGTATFRGPVDEVGTSTFSARFVPDKPERFEPTTARSSTYVLTTARVTATVPATSTAGSTTPGSVSVSLTGVPEVATGQVTVRRGCRLLDTVTLSGGQGQFTLPPLARGANDLQIRWAGDAHAAPAADAARITQAGGPAINPIAECRMGVYKGDGDQAWPPYVKATGTAKQLLAKIALRPKARWFTRGNPNSTIQRKVRDYIAATTHGDPSVMTQMAVFRVDPWEEQACKKLPSAAQQKNYKDYIDKVAAGIGSSQVALILQPDGPFALCAPRGSKLPSHLIAYAAKAFGSLPNTQVYIDAGANDWFRGKTSMAVKLLKAGGIKYARGFAFNSTHYDATGDQVTFGAKVAKALAKAGYADKHFVVNTSSNGRPFPGYTYGKKNFDNATVCQSRTQKRCVTLGIPPTTDVADPKWGLSSSQRSAALAYCDAYLWFGRPWLYNQADPFDLKRALALARTTPY